MKKFIVYLILSVLLVLPLASIIVIAIINQPQNNYISYTAVYDYEDIENNPVEIKDISQVIQCDGILDSSKVEYITTKYDYNDILIKLVDTGDYIEKGDVLFVLNDKYIKSNFQGKIVKIDDYGDKTIVLIKSIDVDTLKVYLPIGSYKFAEETKASFEIGEDIYTAEFSKKQPIAELDKNTFIAHYSISGEDLIIDSAINVSILTGILKKDVYVVPQKCIYQNEYGDFYVQRISEDEKIPIMVELGIMNENEIQIIPIESGQLFEGILVTINNKNVFIVDNEDSNDSES